ncbi:hypothetical protein GCM10009558_029730 [Virgisporangium aurantiacum]
MSGRRTFTCPASLAGVPEAELVFEPVLIGGRDGNIFYQAGAFPSEQEAQKVLKLGRTSRVAARRRT